MLLNACQIEHPARSIEIKNKKYNHERGKNERAG